MTAADLRRDFDRAFAELPAERVERQEDFLRITVGDDPFVVRLADVAGLFADRAITPLPSPVAGLLGLAGFRGIAVPVYDLQSLLGKAGERAPRWLVLAAGSARLAFAFDGFGGHLRTTKAAIATEPSGAAEGPVREIVQVDGAALPVLDLGSVARAIERRARAHREPKAER